MDIVHILLHVRKMCKVFIIHADKYQDEESQRNEKDL